MMQSQRRKGDARRHMRLLAHQTQQNGCRKRPGKGAGSQFARAQGARAGSGVAILQKMPQKNAAP